MRLPIEIEGTLAIEGPGVAATIRGEDRELVCDLPDLLMGWSILKQARQAHVIILPLESMLKHADVILSIRIRGRVIAEAGPGIVTGRLAALFGLAGMRFRLFKRPVTC